MIVTDQNSITRNCHEVVHFSLFLNTREKAHNFVSDTFRILVHIRLIMDHDMPWIMVNLHLSIEMQWLMKIIKGIVFLKYVCSPNLFMKDTNLCAFYSLKAVKSLLNCYFRMWNSIDIYLAVAWFRTPFLSICNYLVFIISSISFSISTKKLHISWWFFQILNFMTITSNACLQDSLLFPQELSFHSEITAAWENIISISGRTSELAYCTLYTLGFWNQCRWL